MLQSFRIIFIKTKVLAVIIAVLEELKLDSCAAINTIWLLIIVFVLFSYFLPLSYFMFVVNSTKYRTRLLHLSMIIV